jgi:hypothetical protein
MGEEEKERGDLELSREAEARRAVAGPGIAYFASNPGPVLPIQAHVYGPGRRAICLSVFLSIHRPETFHSCDRGPEGRGSADGGFRVREWPCGMERVALLLLPVSRKPWQNERIPSDRGGGLCLCGWIVVGSTRGGDLSAGGLGSRTACRSRRCRVPQNSSSLAVSGEQAFVRNCRVHPQA